MKNEDRYDKSFNPKPQEGKSKAIPASPGLCSKSSISCIVISIRKECLYASHNHVRTWTSQQSKQITRRLTG